MSGTADRALLFDFDGLVIDTEGLYASCLLAVLAERGVVADLVGIGHLFGSTGPENEAAWAERLAAWEAEGDGRPLDQAVLDAAVLEHAAGRFDELPLLPGVAELFAAARPAGWATAIATGKARWRLDEHLARLGIAGAIDAIATSEEVAAGKPAPDVFLLAAERLGVEPARCVVLEDSVPGCVAALAAGMAAVACPGSVTSALTFPEGVRRVGSLLEIDLEALAATLPPPV